MDEFDITMPKLVLDEELQALVRNAGVPVKYPKGQIIFSADEFADRVYLIEDGYIKVYRVTNEGRHATLGSLRQPGELMGMAEALNDAKRTCFAGAVTDVALVMMTKDQFLGVLLQNNRLAVQVASMLAARMRAAESTVGDLICWQIPARLATTLLKLSKSNGEETEEGLTIKPKLNYSEIAAMIGSSRQTVTTLMNVMRNQGCVSVENREITVRDPDKLARWVR